METAFHTTGTRGEEGCSRSVQMEFAGWPEQWHGGWRGGRERVVAGWRAVVRCSLRRSETHQSMKLVKLSNKLCFHTAK